ncbi:HAMP domain-containing protein [Rhodovastum atsumiense]|uniref:HAMP domain-containing protein n=1 Tax=Rhodovastum atsumiense TaxID=504468 RepID=A0A5M6IRI4_9PROT|nr:cache domain-containing protein [Rhodovastum atsumiense]KAA5610178.1 HAMP domain-containing protein [Rhodovastum atsumiense]CAH2599272.1 HAMP domain-containing protein [Rhodovastum atsumiense]
MHFLHNRRLPTKLMLLLGILVLATVVVLAVSARLTHERMINDRTAKLRALVDVAVSAASQLEAEVVAGRIDRAEALSRFRKLIYATRYEKDEYLFAYDFDGRMVASGPHQQAEGQNRLQVQDARGTYLIRDLIAVARSGGGVVEYWYPRGNGGDPLPKRSYATAFAPWQIMIGTGVYIDDIDTEFAAYLRLVGLILLGGLALAGAMAVVIGRDITGSMRRTQERLQRLAEGDHASPVAQTGRGDEIGAMARALEVVRQGAAEADRLRGEREALKQRAEADRMAALSGLADALERAVGGVLRELQSEATEMESAAGLLSRTAGEVNTRVNTAAQGAGEATGNVQAVAAAAEELSRSIDEISQRVALAAAVARKASGRVSTTSTQVAELAGAAGEIGRVVELIQTIAGQTNLLALNATIEAARAGEAGRGFAVVANEVKALAAQTARATEDIRGQIERIQSSTERAVAAVEGIAEAVTEVDGISTTIAAAVEEQGAATREIAGNVSRAAQATGVVSDSVTALQDTSGTVNTTATVVLGTAGKLSGSANALRQEMGRFLAEMRTQPTA